MTAIRHGRQVSEEPNRWQNYSFDTFQASMKLHQVRDVIAVAEKGSLRAASRHLGLAQSAITRSIRQLEQELGVPLFERRKRGIVVTPMGSLFLRRARIAASELGRAREEIQQHLGGTEGSVVVCLSTVPHIALVPRAIGAFRKRYPQVRLHIIESVVYASIEQRLKEGSVDFYVGIVPEDGPAPELIMEKLFENTRVVMGRTGHPLAAATSLADLVDAEWVSGGDKAEMELAANFRQHGITPPRCSAIGDSALSLIVLIAYTDMLAILPRQWIEFPPISAVLQKIHVKERIFAPPIALIRRADMPLTPAAEYLSDLLRRACAE
jgi:DNA-binding transcriptional LysR family regulator